MDWKKGHSLPVGVCGCVCARARARVCSLARGERAWKGEREGEREGEGEGEGEATLCAVRVCARACARNWLREGRCEIVKEGRSKSGTERQRQEEKERGRDGERVPEMGYLGRGESPKGRLG